MAYDVEKYVRDLVEAAPPLTAEQRDVLADLLSGTTTGEESTNNT
ncbi:MAG TPA: hypothetical protein VFJ17_05510 [Mycobacteriales bacterium]|jgi:hypothetical protein|nr:hypothetical protein [Mycobacteriales bacterium]